MDNNKDSLHALLGDHQMAEESAVAQHEELLNTARRSFRDIQRKSLARKEILQHSGIQGVFKMQWSDDCLSHVHNKIELKTYLVRSLPPKR